MSITMERLNGRRSMLPSERVSVIHRLPTWPTLHSEAEKEGNPVKKCKDSDHRSNHSDHSKHIDCNMVSMTFSSGNSHSVRIMDRESTIRISSISTVIHSKEMSSNTMPGI